MVTYTRLTMALVVFLDQNLGVEGRNLYSELTDGAVLGSC